MIAALLKLLSYAAKSIREAPPGSNAGELVESIQRWSGGKKGDSWCAEFVFWVGSLAAAVSGGTWPLPRTGSCEVLHQFALKRKMLVPTPRVGDVFLLLNDEGHAHHTGFVILPGLEHFDEISGNTTLVTGSREGWGVFQNSRTYDAARFRFIRWSDAPATGTL